MRRISGRRRFNDKTYVITEFNNDKSRMVRQAKRYREVGWNARVVPLKSAKGYGLYIGQRNKQFSKPRRSAMNKYELSISRRKYNAERWQPKDTRSKASRMAQDANKLKSIPWRRFQDSVFGIDTPSLVAWLQQQPEYVEGLSWQENLRRIGGSQAEETLRQLMNPDEIRGERANPAAISNMWNQQLAEQGFAPGTDWEALGGFDQDTRPEKTETDDIFDLLDLFDADDQDSGFSEDLLDSWFQNGLDGFGGEGFDGISSDPMELERQVDALIGAAKQGAERERAEKKPTLIDRELSAMMDDVFNDAIFGEQESITTPDGRVIERPDTSISALGFAQPAQMPGSSAGYWTFIPNSAGALTTNQTDTRSAWLITDSLGTVMGAYPYEAGEDERAKRNQFEAVRAAFLFAQEASDMTPYSSSQYMEHNKLSPGVAVIDGYLTINEAGQWLGWDVKHTSEDHRLEEGDFRYFLDGEAIEDPPATYTRNWVLPRWNPSNPDNVGKRNVQFDRLVGLIGQEGIEAAEQEAVLARAEFIRRQGGSAEEVLDAMQGARYQVQQLNGQPVTDYMPDIKTALQFMQQFDGGGSPGLQIVKSISNADGALLPQTATVHADLQYLDGKWLIDYRL